MKILSSKSVEISIFFMVLFMGAYLRFWNLEMNPAWYTDEATHIEIARNILHGENRYFAIQDSYLLFARLPLFEYSLALVFRIFGVSMLSLRGFTASLGMLSILLLYRLIRDLSRNRYLSLLAAFAYAIMPQAVLYNRFGFSYNLLAPLILLSLWGAVRYEHSRNVRWLALISACIGIGAISEFLAWSCLPLLLLIGRSWRERFAATGIALVPLGIYCLWQMLTVPDAFLFDLGYSLGRTGGGTIFQQIGRLAENLTVLLSDGWWLAAIIGLFLLKDAALRKVCLLFLLPLLFLARTVPLYSLSAYYTLPFLPILAIGLASLLYRGALYILENFGRMMAVAVIGLLFIMPLAYISLKESQKASSQYPTAIDPFLLNPSDVMAVVEYIHMNSGENDIVIASAPVAALLERQGVDFQMSVVAMGYDAIHIPHNLAARRFAYSADYREANYVVVDNLWRNWGAVHIPAIGEILADVESWEMVFQSGTLEVYQR